jgi:hypothetical protein
MRLLSKAEVFAAPDIITEDVPVPEWGEDVGVRIKVITCEEHAAFVARVDGIDDDAMVTAHLAIESVVDADGKPLFGPEDIAGLMKKSASAVKRIGERSMRLNRLGKAAAEETRKNSETTRFQTPPTQLRRLMSYPDFVLLLQAEAVELRGEVREDMRMARICSVLFNSWRGKNQEPRTIDDYLFKFWQERSGRSNLAQRLRAYTASVGGTIHTKG